MRHICGVIAAANGGADAVEAVDRSVRLLDDDGEFITASRDSVPRNASGEPEAVRLGQHTAMMPGAAPGGSESRPAELPDDPVGIQVGTGTGRGVSEESVTGQRLGPAEALQRMFPGLILSQVPDVPGETSSG